MRRGLVGLLVLAGCEASDPPPESCSRPLDKAPIAWGKDWWAGVDNACKHQGVTFGSCVDLSGSRIHWQTTGNFELWYDKDGKLVGVTYLTDALPAACELETYGQPLTCKVVPLAAPCTVT